MSFLRLINLKEHYSRRKKRLSSLAFRPSSNGGISVVNRECVNRTGTSLCEYLARCYPVKITGDPIAFWQIPNHIIPLHCQSKQTPSEKDKKCHYEIFGWATADAEQTIKKLPLSEIDLCAEDGFRKVQTSDLEQLGD